MNSRTRKPVEGVRQQSEARRIALEQRRLELPQPVFDNTLPVCERRDEIEQAIRQHQVVVVAGETGSGKTTQLPKICLSLGRGVSGLIGHTQPRRIAARSVAARIASELNSEPGRWVGHKVRFSDRTTPTCAIKLMTDGILLAETRSDPLLRAYDTLIIDEAHERSLNIDFLLGYLHRLLPRRPDLKLIITSATIDTARFSEHFHSAPVVEVSGRSYPVELRYRPLLEREEESDEGQQIDAILAAVDELAAEGPGDILIFLSGEREIRDTAEALRKHHPPQTEIVPLYARLSSREQSRVFAPHAGRRIVLATNVAETSLTVPGIRYVVDPGMARISRYSPRSKIQRLPIEAVSQASARQRAGRCGRVAPGIAIRLYSEEELAARPPFTDPEIKRTNLAAVILQMASLRLGAVESFPFIEPPDRRAVNDGYRTLIELGALDDARQLTPLGRDLARLPIDPTLGRMVLQARKEGALREVLIIVSALSLQDPRERPHDRREAADEAHRRWADERSDFLSLLKLWEFYHNEARHNSRSRLQRICRQHFLSASRMREWHDIHQQLRNQISDMGYTINEIEADERAIHRSLLSGLLSRIGNRDQERGFLGARNLRFQIFPGSALYRKPPKWVMAAEITETSRLYARTVAAIEPEWAESLAPHLIKRHYSEPHWSKRAGQVSAWMRITLHGLTLVPRRRCNYGPIDPVVAREIFIRDGLVTDSVISRGHFRRHNLDLIAELEGIESRLRRRDLVIDEQRLYDFFDARIPAGIYSTAAFERWRRQAEQHEPRLLFLERTQLLAGFDADQNQFPDRRQLGDEGLVVPLHYRFEPGSDDDGVTAEVPLAALGRIDPARCEWLVPGLLHERVVAMVKGLPKGVRKSFVPVPDVAHEIINGWVETIADSGEPLTTALSRSLQRRLGRPLEAIDWHGVELPDHLRMRFRLVDERGATIATGRDLERLQREHGERAVESLRQLAGTAKTAGQEEGMRRWSCGPLDEVVHHVSNGVDVVAYPALVASDNGVDLAHFDRPDRALAAHRQGVGHLIRLMLAREVKYLERNLPGIERIGLRYATLGPLSALRQEMVVASIDQTFLAEGPLPRSREQLEQRISERRAALVGNSNQLCGWLDSALAEWHALRPMLQKPKDLRLAPLCQSQLEHARRLIAPGFLARTPWPRLAHLARYLRAINLRLEKAPRQLDRDRNHQHDLDRIGSRIDALASREGTLAVDSNAITTLRWQLEELQVSLFAQELGTEGRVSVVRIERELELLERGPSSS